MPEYTADRRRDNKDVRERALARLRRKEARLMVLFRHFRGRGDAAAVRRLQTAMARVRREMDALLPNVVDRLGTTAWPYRRTERWLTERAAPEDSFLVGVLGPSTDGEEFG